MTKVEPKAIGVGQYQHDVDQKLLNQKLDEKVEDIVNGVGVDVNTASYTLLQYCLYSHLDVYKRQVAAPCLEIQKDPETAYDYTWKNNSVAVVSDGTAVLGLGNICLLYTSRCV